MGTHERKKSLKRTVRQKSPTSLYVFEILLVELSPLLTAIHTSNLRARSALVRQSALSIGEGFLDILHRHHGIYIHRRSHLGDEEIPQIRQNCQHGGQSSIHFTEQIRVEMLSA